MRRAWSCRVVFVVLVSCVVSGAITHASPVECPRIVAIGDLHGGLDSLVTMLETTGLIDDDRRFTPGDACLVIVGDLVDRGERSRELLDYVMSLQEQAPARVHVTLGNHEVMNLVGDLRYVTAGEFAAYRDLETDKQREQGYRLFVRARAARDLSRKESRELFERDFPPGWFGHRQAFRPEGPYGSWLLSLPVLLRLDSTLFVHGGIEIADAAVGTAVLNERIVGQIVEYVRLRDRLADVEWLGPLVPFGAAFAVTEEQLASGGAENGGSAGARATATRFLELRDADFSRADGPLWTRDLALEDEESHAATVAEILRLVGVERIVVGHTTQEDHRIKSRFGGRVFLIDTGAGPAYGEHPSALQIEGDVVRAVYPDGVEALTAAEVPAAATP